MLVEQGTISKVTLAKTLETVEIQCRMRYFSVSSTLTMANFLRSFMDIAGDRGMLVSIELATLITNGERERLKGQEPKSGHSSSHLVLPAPRYI